ncbi:MAG: AEC family transporter [Rhizobiaceae bacterium]|nr:AEC family transporter [Rhizobiaceae bacterium]
MLSVLLTILPVFLILGSGYLLARLKYLPDSVADALNTYALKLGVPVLLFLAMFRLDFSTAFNAGMLVSFYTGAFTCFIAGIVLSRIIWKRRPGESVAVGFCAVFSNTVLIGLPISQLAFGETVLTPVFGIVAFHASLLYTVGMITMEFARRDGRRLGDTLKSAFSSVIANPLMVGILLGVTANLIGLWIPSPVEQALDLIRATAIPVSLVGIGIALTRYSISSELTETLMVSFFALIVHPAIALFMCLYVFDVQGDFLKAAVVLAAMPPGMNIYIFASIYQRALNLSASVLVIANMLAVFSIPAWILIIKSLS